MNILTHAGVTHRCFIQPDPFQQDFALAGSSVISHSIKLCPGSPVTRLDAAPAQRVSNILRQAGCRILVAALVVEAIRGQLPAGVDVLVADELWAQFADRPTTNVERRGCTGDYSMCTSGSTGEPKGIAVQHSGVLLGPLLLSGLSLAALLCSLRLP